MKDFVQFVANTASVPEQDREAHFFVPPVSRLRYFRERLAHVLLGRSAPMRAELVFHLDARSAARINGFGPDTIELNSAQTQPAAECGVSVDLWNPPTGWVTAIWLVQYGPKPGPPHEEWAFITPASQPVHRAKEVMSVRLVPDSRLSLSVLQTRASEDCDLYAEADLTGYRVPAGGGFWRRLDWADMDMKVIKTFGKVFFVSAADETRPKTTAAAKLASRMGQMVLGAILLLLSTPIMFGIAACLCARCRCNPFYARRWWTCQRKPGLPRAVKITTMKPMPNERPAEEARNALLPCGRFLRVTGLDELPQLALVALGIWDLVGWRSWDIVGMYADRLPPEVVDAYLQAPFRARPGLVSLADAVKTRSLRGINLVSRYLYDKWYARHAQWKLTVRLTAWALGAMITADGDEDYEKAATYVPRALSADVVGKTKIS